MDKLTKEQRKKCMSSIRSRDSAIELRLRKALWHRGYRYRKNYKELPGKPDIVITKYRIAIFCDSEFFHGKDWNNGLKDQINKGSNKEFWENKILKNMERDLLVNKQLKAKGWNVLRFWGKDIQKKLDECLKTVDETVFDIKLEAKGVVANEGTRFYD